MCGEVVDVDALVGAAGGEHDFLTLAWDQGGGGREGNTLDGGGVGGEEEGVGEGDFGRGGGSGVSDGGLRAVEDAVVGASDNLDCYG